MGKINRVLIMAHPEMDHLAYAMYDGLYKVLGKDNVDIYPYVRHYQGQGNIDNWYTLDDGKTGFTEAPGYIGSHQTPEKSFDELANNIKSYDLIYLSSGRTYAMRSLDQFIARCGRQNLPPIAAGEGEDYHILDTLRMIKHKYNTLVCFKREYIQSEINIFGDIHPIYPLPFAAVTDNISSDNPNKDIDVFALFGNTYHMRENIVKLINSSHLIGKYNVYVGIDHFEHGSIPTNAAFKVYREYQDMMSRAKINIVARGHGCDTLRRFEALCYSGLVLMDTLPIVTPDQFLDNTHVKYYNNNLSDLINLIEYYLNNSGERERIGRAGRDHCMNYHTTDARARYFLNKVEQHM